MCLDEFEKEEVYTIHAGMGVGEIVSTVECLPLTQFKWKLNYKGKFDKCRHRTRY